MTISRQLAHKLNNRLQLISLLIEDQQPNKAVAKVQELSQFINAHVESKEEEKARHAREEN